MSQDSMIEVELDNAEIDLQTVEYNLLKKQVEKEKSKINSHFTQCYHEDDTNITEVITTYLNQEVRLMNETFKMSKITSTSLYGDNKKILKKLR
jgi:uncharacterized protein YbcC (UPF0753/DUF2309 family)